jgi:hypothetical protein
MSTFDAIRRHCETLEAPDDREKPQRPKESAVLEQFRTALRSQVRYALDHDVSLAALRRIVESEMAALREHRGEAGKRGVERKPRNATQGFHERRRRHQRDLTCRLLSQQPSKG